MSRRAPKPARKKRAKAADDGGDAAVQSDLFADAAEAAAEGLGFSVDLDGFEGPLHVLLALARAEKVDLRALRIDTLADQYLAFVDAARVMRLELAADYLVMAAWLTLLKSKLLLPRAEGEARDEDGLPPEELAKRLAFRLRRLEAMRLAGERLQGGNIDGRDVRARGAPEGVRARSSAFEASLYDLLKAYGGRRSTTACARVRIPRPNVYALDDARVRLERLLPQAASWRALNELAPPAHAFSGEPPPAPSRLASAFCAALELTRDGSAELRQEALFGALFVRARRPSSDDAAPAPAPDEFEDL